MSELLGYPYVPGSHGIPLEGIKRGFQEISLQGGSGRELKGVFSKRTISVIDENDKAFRLYAHVTQYGVLGFSLRTTRLSTQEKHPDFFAAKFIDFSMRYFDTQKVKIKKFAACWVKRSGGSTNYDQFMESFVQTGDEKLAASQTWSAKIMAQYGFTKIEEIDREKVYVDVLFGRE